MKQIEVVAAIIRKGDKIFATQRGYGEWQDWWEFPGGKMEAGETPEEALKREIWEELETSIVVERLVQTVEYDYPQLASGRACSRSAEQANLRRSRLLGANKMRLPCVGLLVDKSNPAGEALYSSAGFRYVGDSQWGGHPMKHMVL